MQVFGVTSVVMQQIQLVSQGTAVFEHSQGKERQICHLTFATFHGELETTSIESCRFSGNCKQTGQKSFRTFSAAFMSMYFSFPNFRSHRSAQECPWQRAKASGGGDNIQREGPRCLCNEPAELLRWSEPR